MKKHLIFIIAVLFVNQLYSQTYRKVEGIGYKTKIVSTDDRTKMQEYINARKVNDFQFEHVDIPLFNHYSERNDAYSKNRSENNSNFSYVEIGDVNRFSDKDPVVQTTDKSNQCNYIFECRDTYGDGWNQTQMQVKQNGIVIATLGVGFTGGQSFPQTVALTDGVPFEVFWSVKGLWANEVGLRIFNPDGYLIYNQVPIGQHLALTTIFTSVANCTLPLCQKPAAIQATNTTTQSAILQWTENGSATTWEIEWGPFLFAQGTGNNVATTTKPYYMNGLTENTYYDVYIRSLCSSANTNSDWVGPYTFKTQCSAFTVPYYENFQNFMTNWCWTIQDVDGGEASWGLFNDNGNFSLQHGFNIYGYYEEGVIFSPNITLPNVLGLKLEFWSFNFDANYYGQNSVLISADNWITSQVLWAPTSVPEQTWQKTVKDISAYKGSTIQFAFKYQGTNAHTWLIDSVSVYEGIPEKVLNVNVLLQGLYSTTSPGTMNQANNTSGTEYGADITDKITIELRDAINPNIIHYQNSNVFLNTNGIAEISDVPFTLTDSYYIVIKHRNHIETWSAAPVLFGSAGQVSYDFSTSAANAFGNNMKNVGAGYYALFCGDINQDGIIDGSDMSIVDNASSQFVIGYTPQDLNGDGIVDSSDMSIVDNNITGFIQVKRP
jgi:hypothetical protein